MKDDKENLTDKEALSVLEEIIVSWEFVNNGFPKDINAHSMVLNETQIAALKSCAERLRIVLAGDLTPQNELKSGWQPHPGTNCGHYFPAGEDLSLCRRERRTGNETIENPLYKCAVCEKRTKLARTPNLFG